MPRYAQNTVTNSHTQPKTATCQYNVQTVNDENWPCTPILLRDIQKTREGSGCFWDLFGGSQGKFWGNPGGICGKTFPESRSALNSGIWGHWERQTCREPWGDAALNPDGTFSARWFLKSTDPTFSSFSETYSVWRLLRPSSGSYEEQSVSECL